MVNDAIDRQVLLALDQGQPCSSAWIRKQLASEGSVYTGPQVTASLQRLRRQKLAIYGAAWHLSTSPAVNYDDALLSPTN